MILVWTFSNLVMQYVTLCLANDVFLSVVNLQFLESKLKDSSVVLNFSALILSFIGLIAMFSMYIPAKSYYGILIID